MIIMRLAALAAIVVLFASAEDAAAALTTDKCLAQKRQAWITFRKCQVSADVKRLKGKPADHAKCQTQLHAKLAKVDAKATKAAIACRYRASSDGTVTDYDTALMWEMKTGTVGGGCIVFAGIVSHCVDLNFTWADAHAYAAGSGNGSMIAPFLAGYTDWRVPTSVELLSIGDVNACPVAGDLCIDPIFGPTSLGAHWSSTSSTTQSAYVVDFGSAELFQGSQTLDSLPVRAVRRAF